MGFALLEYVFRRLRLVGLTVQIGVASHREERNQQYCIYLFHDFRFLPLEYERYAQIIDSVVRVVRRSGLQIGIPEFELAERNQIWTPDR